jgi:hypothetical protein
MRRGYRRLVLAQPFFVFTSMPVPTPPPPSPCKVEAAHRTRAQIRETQRIVDAGNQPWRLDSPAVATKEAEAWLKKKKLNPSSFREKSASVTELAAIYVYDLGSSGTLTLYLQRANHHAIWVLHQSEWCPVKNTR